MELPPVFQQLQLPLLALNLIFATGFKPGFLRILLTFPTLILLFTQSIYRKEFMYYGVAYPMNVAACCFLFSYLDQILLASPDKERWHKIQYDGKGKVDDNNGKIDAVPSTFLGRIWWGIRISTTTRFTGWSQQVKNVQMEVPANYPRWQFIVRKSLRAAFFFVLSDTIQSWTASTPHGSYRGYENGKVPISLTGLPLIQQCFYSWVQIVLTYTVLELYNVVYGIVSVLSGLANPRDCPSLFTDLRGMYTVRNSWSLVWHQQCRRACSSPSIFLARDVLHLKKGGFASKYLQLFMGFAISGIVHAGGSMLVYKSWTKDNAAMACFLAQAAAIMFEDHVIDFGRYIGLRDSPVWRTMGYVWVLVWFGLSTIGYTSAILDSGLWIHAKQFDFFGIGPQA
ncbi:hypothetical protein K505DRAFT_329868 [Melanomma pulvis-pyrius CBS 109.77]|uniref:Wax synthase domain-containing protein n=1 Tax=Melanomma pulvis-pyrius CBS 109.77 TaxID=1314802 RepID=A0A6A6WSN4_9PLEO|nr:hypothetical protein K505DRAFT_329868 [Melanomma pulvis-pyrius CBS 109.77]